MAKGHVKKDLPVTLVLKPIKVKTLFLNLQKDKDTNKNKVDATSKDQLIIGKCHLGQIYRNREVSVKLCTPVPDKFWAGQRYISDVGFVPTITSTPEIAFVPRENLSGQGS